MNVREGALVAFTLLMQTSVGVLLVVAALQALVPRALVHGSARPFDAPLLVATAAGLLALLASLFHLGHPFQAWLALANVRTSWLSREVVLAASFVACTGLYTLLARTGTASPTLRAACCLLAAALGVVAISAMSRLYMVPAQPAWNRALTPATFAAATLLLGIVIVMLVTDPGVKSGVYASRAGRMLPWLAIALLVVQVLLLPLHLSAVAAEPAAAISAGAAGTATAWLAAARAVAAIASIVLLAVWGRLIPGVPAAPGLALLLLVVVSEACGRLLFYAASVHLGPV
jgi:anaerobic dimethyl sulfoxide reductase subunit C (anchor subunit)